MAKNVTLQEIKGNTIPIAIRQNNHSHKPGEPNMHTQLKPAFRSLRKNHQKRQHEPIITPKYFMENGELLLNIKISSKY